MAELNETQVQTVTNEILEHMMDPKNYGKMENPTCVGMGVDTKTGEFVLIYLDLENDIIKDVKHMCNACQDTVIAGSLFTEMIKGESID
ncbi:MAG TPA: iron-sulfur cluster assembly scaffold protein [Arcobacter sp.]|nr:iron-sulfur cluster assembly scaffold protein [Arcobacter sp.]